MNREIFQEKWRQFFLSSSRCGDRSGKILHPRHAGRSDFIDIEVQHDFSAVHSWTLLELSEKLRGHPLVMCEASEGPSTPWISFKVLFRLFQDKISVIARELLCHHDEELKEGKITCEEMVKKMMILVGEKILMEALEDVAHLSHWKMLRQNFHDKIYI